MSTSYLQHTTNINFRLINNKGYYSNFAILKKFINIILDDIKSKEVVYIIISFLNGKISLVDLKNNLMKFKIYLNPDKYLEYCDNLYLRTSLSSLFKNIFVNKFGKIYYGDTKEKAYEKLLTLKNYSYKSKIDENLFNSNYAIDNYTNCINIGKIKLNVNNYSSHNKMLVAIRFIISDANLLKQVLFHKDEIIKKIFRKFYCSLIFNSNEMSIIKTINKITNYLALGALDINYILNKLELKNARILSESANGDLFYYQYNLLYKLYLAKDDEILIRTIIKNIPNSSNLNSEFEELKNMILGLSDNFINYKLLVENKNLNEFIANLEIENNLELLKDFLNSEEFKCAYKSRNAIWVDSSLINLPYNFDVQNSNINNLIAINNNILIHIIKNNNNWYVLNGNKQYKIKKINDFTSKCKVISFAFCQNKELAGKNKKVIITNDEFGEVTVPYSKKSEFEKEDELFKYMEQLEINNDISDLKKHISLQKKVDGEDSIIESGVIRRKFSLINNLDTNINMPYVMFSDYIKIIKDNLVLNFNQNINEDQIRTIKEQIMSDLVIKFMTLLKVLRKYRINHNDLHSNNLKISLKNEFYPNTTIFKIDSIKAFDWGKLKIKNKFFINQDIKLAYNELSLKLTSDGCRQLYVFLSRSYSGAICDLIEFYRKTPLAYIYSICYNDFNIYKQFKHRDIQILFACIIKIIRKKLKYRFNYKLGSDKKVLSKVTSNKVVFV